MSTESILTVWCIVSLGRFTFTKVFQIIVDTGLSVALISEKEKFEVSSSYSNGKHPQPATPIFFMRLYTGKIYKSVIFGMIKSV